MNQISTYATLQTAVAGMVHRDSDTNITVNVPLFVQLAEARLNDMLLLKDMETEGTLTATANLNYIALPTGFVNLIKLWDVVSSVRQTIEILLPEQLEYSPYSSRPRFAAVDGPNLRFDCPADSAYSYRLRYVKASNLSVSNTTNYLLLKRPDVYLWGALVETYGFMADPQNQANAEGRFQQAVASLKAAESRNRAIAPLRSDIPGRSRAGSILTGD